MESFTYRFVGQVERVFGHLAHDVDGATTVTVDGELVEAAPNQTVELHPGDDVVLTTDTPQHHAELEPVNDAAIAAADQPAPVTPEPESAPDPTTQTEPHTSDPVTETTNADPQADPDPTTQNTTETS